MNIREAARTAAIAVAVVAWAAAAHYTSALVASSAWGALLGLSPLAAIATAFAWRSPHRPAMLALLALAAAGLTAVWPQLVQNVGWLYFVQHVGTNALLGVAFGRTLGHGRKPMCTGLAALVHPELSPRLERYTRQITVAWSLFFALMSTASVLLFAFAPITVWSAFANLLTLPLVALMFAAEYAVRRCVLPPEDRSGVLDAVRAYWRSSAPATPSDR
ncbi:hypothetical protein [Thauera chlorobenzoica]|uniref:Uncharacterized protein n=1 Tax=Thauera chlorobenzoica TaxID=96773 RepID=A0A1H5UKU1_9RHOO|nr:hypothetical protein [Thauera chlorobenzoica]APR03607.1 hypothetical protein Tchl_0743 [Thauera chlorobenzoica]SEF75048.1 Uncharacterized membrane protein [Thauera chlorobenzoica]